MINLQEAKERMNEAVEIRGADFVYPDNWKIPTYDGEDLSIAESGICRYFLDDGRPACIIGLGFEDILTSLVESGVYIETEYVGAILNEHVEPNALTYLGYVQTGQDMSKPWGEAVKDAEKAIEVNSVKRFI